MSHGDAREGKWRGNWRVEWVASTLHTTSEHGVSSITNADAHNSAASSRLNWRSRQFKWTRPFRRKKNSPFCACAITFQTQSSSLNFQGEPRGTYSRAIKIILFLANESGKRLSILAVDTDSYRGACSWPWRWFTLVKADLPLLVTSNRCIKIKNTLDWSVFALCERDVVI